MSGKTKSTWAQLLGTVLGFIAAAGGVILLSQNGSALDPDRIESSQLHDGGESHVTRR